eukprot:3437718-Rhodomonas_salina.2
MAPDVIKTWEILRTDRAGEMCSDEAEKCYKLYRIFHESSNPHQHRKNPHSENAIGELGVCTRVIMAHAGALGRYWAWHGEPPTAVTCPTWGCLAYVFVERKCRKVSGDGKRSGGKLGDTSLSGTFLGFAHRIRHKGYMVLLNNKRTIVISTHVTFNEGVMPMKEEGSSRKCRAPEIPREVFGERLETLPLDLDETGELEIAFTDEDETEIEMVSDEQAARVRTQAQK